MSNDYKQELSNMLESLIYNHIYPFFEDGKMSLELFITTYCNKRCSYCYLQQNKDKLYPAEFQEPNIILSNLKILFEHLIEKNIKVKNLDLYSGDIWHLDFGKAILLNILDYVDKGLAIKNILIPTNGSFLNDDNNYFFYNDLIDKFNERKIHLRFSFSNDGQIIDSLNRPFAEKEYECNYQNLFSFSQENILGYHPMIDANEIEK